MTQLLIIITSIIFVSGEEAVKRDGKVDLHSWFAARLSEQADSKGWRKDAKYRARWPVLHESVAARSSVATKSIISQEIDEIRNYADLCRTRIKLLKQLKELLNPSLPLGLPATQLQTLRELVPKFSELSAERLANREEMPIASPDDYIVQTTARHLDGSLGAIELVATSPKAVGSDAAPNDEDCSGAEAAFILAPNNSRVELLSSTGNHIYTFVTGHAQPIAHLAWRFGTLEHVIMTADLTGRVQIHKFKLKHKRYNYLKFSSAIAIAEKKTSPFLGPIVDVSVELHCEIQFATEVTSVTVVSYGGTPIFLVGDATGKITFFSRDCNKRTVVNVSPSDGAAVVKLRGRDGFALWSSSTYYWGMLNLDNGNLIEHKCAHLFPAKLRSVTMDMRDVYKLIGADLQGNIWVFSIRKGRACTAEHVFNTSSLRIYEVEQIAGYIIALGSSENTDTIVAYNLSHMGRTRIELEPYVSPIVWRMERPRIKAWSLLRFGVDNPILAILYEDGKDLEVMHMLMKAYITPSEPTTSIFFTYIIPAITALLLVAVSIQYMTTTAQYREIGKVGKNTDLADS